MTLGDIIKKKRLELNMGVHTLADMCGVSPIYISNVENDISSLPPQGLIHKLAKILGLDADSLLVGIGVIPEWAQEKILKNWKSIKDKIKNP